MPQKRTDRRSRKKGREERVERGGVRIRVAVVQLRKLESCAFITQELGKSKLTNSKTNSKTNKTGVHTSTGKVA